MSIAVSIIGAGFGDEGKGMTTCAVSNFIRSKNIDDVYGFRFNGGAQAGHTVEYRGYRHVHQSVNSFSIMANGATIYTEDVVVNPYVVRREIAAISSLFHTNPFVAITDKNPISTHFDVIANQIFAKAANTNSTCGVGINTTIRRHEQIPLTYTDLIRGMDVYSIISNITSYYEEKFIQAGLNQHQCEGFFDTKNVERVCSGLLGAINTKDFVRFKKEQVDFDDSYFIFEGAQGLLLDQEYGQFPFVTPSNTGSKNVISFLNTLSNKPIYQPIYCTRPFLTRHGDGPFQRISPFSNEMIDFCDQTNVTNQYQGEFKIGMLDINQLRSAIQWDYEQAKSSYWCVKEPLLSISHADFFDETGINVIVDGNIRHVTSIDEFCNLLEFDVCFLGYSPAIENWRTRKEIF